MIKIVFEYHLKASAEKVFEAYTDPQATSQLFPNEIKSVQREGVGPLQTGEVYQVTHVTGSKELRQKVVIESSRPYESLTAKVQDTSTQTVVDFKFTPGFATDSSSAHHVEREQMTTVRVSYKILFQNPLLSLIAPSIARQFQSIVSQRYKALNQHLDPSWAPPFQTFRVTVWRMPLAAAYAVLFAVSILSTIALFVLA